MASSEPDLLFVPLGGAGEIGMNLSLYGYDGQWIIVDCGVTFADEHFPGIEVFVPDISYIRDEISQIEAIFLTHAHEDHLGAVHHLWKDLNCPVYATPFASGLLRRKLTEAGLLNRVPIHEVPCGGGAAAGPFSVEFIPLAHSIPETHALAITTPAGTVLHATDWKLDPEPLIGPCTDEAALRRVGENGVVALMCDSTNVLVEGTTGSEGPLRNSLTEIIGKCRKRVIIACFASNVARVASCVAAAEKTGRSVGLVGRSLWNMTELARNCGYLEDCPDFLSPEEAGFLPRDKALIMVTGSQGESRAALSRIATDSHRDIMLEEGDTVIFSSREIPGNERAIGRIQNLLAAQGVEIITERDGFVHVSGHPARDELKTLYGWVNPPLLVPIHGETRHLVEHVKFARKNGIPAAKMAPNGSVMRLSPGPAEIIDEVPVGRLAVDGKKLLPVSSPSLKSRRRMGFGGMAVATLVLDPAGRLRDDPELSVFGLIDDSEEDDAIFDFAVDAVMEAVANLRKKARADDEKVKDAARRAIRRVFREERGLKPVIEVHIVRI